MGGGERGLREGGGERGAGVGEGGGFSSFSSR